VNAAKVIKRTKTQATVLYARDDATLHLATVNLKDGRIEHTSQNLADDVQRQARKEYARKNSDFHGAFFDSIGRSGVNVTVYSGPERYLDATARQTFHVQVNSDGSIGKAVLKQNSYSSISR
jgi:hypothetical protein